jgi:hypothetical protein
MARVYERASTQPQTPIPFTSITADGAIITNYYLDNDPECGLLHREDGPACVITYLSQSEEISQEVRGGYVEEWWYEGMPHREGGPARIEVSEEGSYYRMYFHQGQRHREDGPAMEVRDVTTGKSIEWWYEHGRRHREDGPACVIVYGDGRRQERNYERGISVVEASSKRP